MHPITFQLKQRMGRSPHDLTAAWKLEALVPVPVPGHPKSEHFRLLGAGPIQKPIKDINLDEMNEAAQRVAVQVEPQGFRVVVDGKYIAGDFNVAHDYTGELRVAECAVQTSLQLASGHQPADLGMKPVVA